VLVPVLARVRSAAADRAGVGAAVADAEVVLVGVDVDGWRGFPPVWIVRRFEGTVGAALSTGRSRREPADPARTVLPPEPRRVSDGRALHHTTPRHGRA